METTEFQFSEIWVRVYLREQKWLKHSCIINSHHSMGDNSPTLGTWNALRILQTAQQFGECPLQCFGLNPSSRQLLWFLFLPESWCVLRFFVPALVVWEWLIILHCLLWKEWSSLLFILEGKDLLNKVSFSDSLSYFE